MLLKNLQTLGLNHPLKNLIVQATDRSKAPRHKQEPHNSDIVIDIKISFTDSKN